MTTQTTTQINRRRFPRFSLQPMYAPVVIRPVGARDEEIGGYAYDISESGVRFDADRRLPPGTRVHLRITLPRTGHDQDHPESSVAVTADIVRIEDESDPEPVRTAAVFTRFADPRDRERLLTQFAAGRYTAAA